MNHFYSQCCDCHCRYTVVLHDELELVECPNCGLVAALSDVQLLTAELERDQPCPTLRLEVEQEILRLFPQKMTHATAQNG